MKKPVQQAQQGREQRELKLLGERAQQFDPFELFDTWLNRQQPKFLASTQNVYRTLWRRFIEDMKIRQKNLHDIQSQDIQAFLATLEGVKRPQRERYQQVIERAYTEMLRHDPKHVNPAVSTAINDPYQENWRLAPDNEATQFLSCAQIQELLRQLQLAVLALQYPGGYTQAALWRQTRDACIVGLLFACGLRPQELAQLKREQWRKADVWDRVACQALLEKKPHLCPGDELIHIRGVAERCIPVPLWMSPLLSLWEQRSGIVQTELLFPSSRQVSAARPAVSMNPATLARIVTKWGVQHGDLLLTPQRLRNVYGASLIDATLSLSEIELLMGYAPGAASAWRLQASWTQWCQQQT